MRQRQRNRWRTALIFGVTGWLFADLFMALTMGFLAQTVGYVPTPTATATLQPAPPTVIPTATPLPALSLHPIHLTLTVDVQGLENNNPQAIASVEQQIRTYHSLDCKLAGLVLTYGGAPTAGDTGTALRIADLVNTRVFADLGRRHFVFDTTVYRDFFSLGASASSVTADVYIFDNVSSCLPSS